MKFAVRSDDARGGAHDPLALIKAKRGRLTDGHRDAFCQRPALNRRSERRSAPGALDRQADSEKANPAHEPHPACAAGAGADRRQWRR